MKIYSKALKLASLTALALSIAACSSGGKKADNSYSAFISPGDAQYYRTTIDVIEDAVSKKATLTTKAVSPAEQHKNGSIRDIYARAKVNGHKDEITYQIVFSFIGNKAWSDYTVASYSYGQSEKKSKLERIHKEYICPEEKPCTYHEEYAMDISIKDIASYIAHTDKVIWVPYTFKATSGSEKEIELNIFDSELKGLIFMANDTRQHYRTMKQKPIQPDWLK